MWLSRGSVSGHTHAAAKGLSIRAPLLHLVAISDVAVGPDSSQVNDEEHDHLHPVFSVVSQSLGIQRALSGFSSNIPNRRIESELTCH